MLPSFMRAQALAWSIFLAQFVVGTTWSVQDSGYTDLVQWDHYSFILKGERQFLFGGEMHPFRQPIPEMWQDIIQKIKASGMNTMSFYSMWGSHEPYQGQLDFSTGSRDLNLLLEYAEAAGLYVIPRTGPYINAELSAGGFPLWLTNGSTPKLRTDGAAYTATWQDYVSTVAKLIAPHQISQNGTVIAYQVENEFPNQWSDRQNKTALSSGVNYMKALEAVIRSCGIEVATTSNAASPVQDWSPDYDTVGAGGDVNVWGEDSYVSVNMVTASVSLLSAY
jgi:beta-galactosidase GanA